MEKRLDRWDDASAQIEETERQMSGLTIQDIIDRAHTNARLKGFWNEQSINMAGHQMLNQEKVAKTIPEKLALIHSEVSEALECYREKQMVTHIQTCGDSGAKLGKPEGFASELADIVIRVADLCGALGINLEEELRLKMEYNSTRPHMHGKVC